LKGNKTKNGIHFYDENNSGLECGSFTGDVHISNNVIIDQAGAGINIGANCPWTNDFYVHNNLVINSGLAAAWDGLDVNTSDGPDTGGINITDGGLSGTIYLSNNTVIGWNSDGQTNGARAGIGMAGKADVVSVVATDNVIVATGDRPFVAEGCCGAEVQLDNITGSGNLWYSTFSGSVLTIPPPWDLTKVLADPKLTITGSTVSVGAASPIIGKSSTTEDTDIYGVVRQVTSNLGAIQ
jgi:hypothetical protein